MDRTINLMLFYVELGTELTNVSGDINEQFDSSMESMYRKVAKACLRDKNLFAKLEDRLYAIV